MVKVLSTQSRLHPSYGALPATHRILEQQAPVVISETIVVTFPVDEEVRTAYRELIGQPLPAVVPGSVQDTCADCSIPVWVGPRSAATAKATGYPIVCMMCGLKRVRPCDKFETISLGNPDSHSETEKH